MNLLRIRVIDDFNVYKIHNKLLISPQENVCYLLPNCLFLQ